MKVVFPFIAQQHQMLHALPVACELAARHRDIEVHAACLTDDHLRFARHLLQFYPDAPLSLKRMPLPETMRRRIESKGLRVIDRLIGLFLSRKDFRTYDAIIVPEDTSLQLRRMGVTTPRMIWTSHGAGDRAIGFSRHLRRFDFHLVPGAKVERRMRAKGILHPGRYYVGAYAKFDLVQRMGENRPPLFDNGRPVILYNPHFVRHLSSWPKMGTEILEFFARQDYYNLVFAPHIRLFDNHREAGESLKRRYAAHPHMRIDLGSQSSIDMTYTLGADLYLGDVSSQIAEFMVRPRPCVFLNAHEVAWRNDPNYQAWSLGPVTDRTDNLSDVLQDAFKNHPRMLEKQKQYVLETFGKSGHTPTLPAAADAIAEFLQGPPDVQWAKRSFKV